MISYLSDLITIGSQKLAGFIILILPFTSTYLTEKPEVIMLIVGFGGQALFASRFIIQWISSESVGRSIIPIGFWYKSGIWVQHFFSHRKLVCGFVADCCDAAQKERRST